MNKARSIRRRLSTMVAALGLALAGTLVPASPASAQVGDLYCELAFQFTFNPGLSLGNPQGSPVIHATFTNCLSVNQRFSDIHSANVEAVGVATVSPYPLNPCGLLLSVEGTGTFEWSNGQESDFDWEVITDPLISLLTLHANITSGPMTGDTGQAFPIVPIVNADCLLNGLKTIGTSLGVILFN